MKLFEIINENYIRDPKEKLSVINFSDIDKNYNPELDHYANIERTRTKKLKELAGGGVPLITSDQSADNNKPFTNTPDDDYQQSPGYRGLQLLKKRAGLNYRPFDDYDPTYFKTEINL